MRRLLTLSLALILSLAVLGPASGAPQTVPAVVTSGLVVRQGPTVIGAEPVATDLGYPAPFTFAPSGEIFYGERFTGEIRVFDPASGSDLLVTTITDLVTFGEQGLLGLALHPRFPRIPVLYAYATRDETGQRQNQILAVARLPQGIVQRVIFRSDTAAGPYHDGGRILFGPDGRLYAVVGESHDSGNAQDLTNNAGKVLRMTATGAVPPDNPLPGSLNYTYGLRNSYGFAFDPLTGNLWESENGPACNDEINIIYAGRNYGWGPNETCSTPPPPPLNTNQDGPNPVLPQTFYTPTIAPTGVAFCISCGLADSEGKMFFGAYNTGDIWRVTLSPNRRRVESQEVVFTHSEGILSVEVGPDSAIYFSDSGGIWKLVEA